MMRILLLGASGATGQPTLTEALARGYTVTALVRRPEAISPQEGLTIIQGTPASESDILKSFDSAPVEDPIRAVVSALGNGNVKDTSLFKAPDAPADFMATCAKNCITTMMRRDCFKLVWCGTNGVGDSRESVVWILRWIVDHTSLKAVFEDHYQTQLVMEEAGKKDGRLKWTSVRAGRLCAGPKLPIVHHGNDGKGYPTIGNVSRASVGAFLVDCLETDRWNGQTPVITN